MHGNKERVVRLAREGEVKHPKLRTSVTKRMMPLRELQGRPNWERTGWI